MPLEYVNGRPALLVPASADCAPTARDRLAPPLLPSRTYVGELRESFSRSNSKPLRQAPASFERPAPPEDPHGTTGGPTYADFQSFYLPGQPERGAAAFQPRYPAHIMVDHDVSAADWDRFLTDVRFVGKWRGADASAIGLCILTGMVCSMAAFPIAAVLATAVMSNRRAARTNEVLALVETYQYRFFRKRRLDVFVACGASRITGHFPGDMSYLAAPPVEVGMPDSFNAEIEELELLRRVPVAQRRPIHEHRHAHTVPGTFRSAFLDADTRRRAAECQQLIRADKQRRAAERDCCRAQEKLDGTHQLRHGRYRLVVQPLSGPVAQPSDDALAHILHLERMWGYSRMATPDSASDLSPDAAPPLYTS